MKPIYGGLFAVLVLFAGASALAQRSGGNQVSVPAPSNVGTIPMPVNNRSSFPMGSDPIIGPNGMPEMSQRISEQQTKLRNAERQKKIETDTVRLVNLVNELKSHVGGESTISPSDLGKRAEEIERLARSVKDRMKG